MFRHYLLTAWKVLWRRKFFTFVNLFGIALTLAVLTVVIALLENYIMPRGAEASSANFVAVRDVALRNAPDGEHTREWSSPLGYRFLERHIFTLEEPDRIGIVNGPSPGTVFVGGHKLTPSVAWTDAGYWDILEFRFLEGRPISPGDVEQGRQVAVINAAMRDAIFNGESSIDRFLEINGQRFQVVGVVENEPELRLYAYAEIWLPYTSFPSSNYRDEWLGNFSALLYAEDRGDLPAIKEEYQRSLESFEYDDPDRYSVALSFANSKLEYIARDFTNSRYEKDSGAGTFLLMLAGGMLAFMLLPTINLVNLNVSRIMERSSEIGVRKAFGAASSTLVGQFLVENLVLSVLGGLLGFALGALLLDLLEVSGLMAYADITLNWRIFLLAFLAMALFGAISGAYPAWKMSRMDPVDALRRGA